MKAHLRIEPRALLLWKFGPESAGYPAVAAAAARYRLALRLLAEADLPARVGTLCSEAAKGGGSAPAVPQAAPLPVEPLPGLPAAIISGPTPESGELNEVVEALKKTGASLPIKAYVTPTSGRWTLAALLAELGQEHEAVGRPGEGPA